MASFSWHKKVKVALVIRGLFICNFLFSSREIYQKSYFRFIFISFAYLRILTKLAWKFYFKGIFFAVQFSHRKSTQVVAVQVGCSIRFDCTNDRFKELYISDHQKSDCHLWTHLNQLRMISLKESLRSPYKRGLAMGVTIPKRRDRV